MTAMNQGESAASENNTAERLTTATAFRNTGGTAGDHRKAWFKRYFKTRAGKCVIVSALLSIISLYAYLITKIVIGSIYMNSCPEDPFVPIYLVISSVILFLFIIILIAVLIRCPGNDNDEESISPVHLIALVYYFIHLVLQLAGSVCVIRTRNNLLELASEDQNSSFCDKDLMKFAFGVVVFELILSGLCLLVTIFSLCEITYLVCCKQNYVKQTMNNNSTA